MVSCVNFFGCPARGEKKDLKSKYDSRFRLLYHIRPRMANLSPAARGTFFPFLPLPAFLPESAWFSGKIPLLLRKLPQFRTFSPAPLR